MNTIKVLLIDDDALVLDDLRTLIQWEYYGFTIIGEAKNGKEGLKIFYQQQPDLVIVDIYMPILNGLEFCQQVMNEKNPPKIILLTAYKDFEYAKQGIRLGVSNYLLKHEIDEKTLTTELLKVKKDLLHKNNNNKIIQRQIFSQLVTQPFSTFNHSFPPSQWDPNLNHSGSMVLFLLQIDSPFFLMESLSKKIILYPPISTISCIELLLNRNPLPQTIQEIQYIPLNELQSVVLLFFKNNIFSEQNIRTLAYDYALSIQQKFKQNNVSTLSIVLSNPLHSLQEIHPIFNRTVEGGKHLVFTNKNQILWLEDIESKYYHCGDIRKEQAAIKQAFLKKEEKKLTLELKHGFEKTWKLGWDLCAFTDLCRKLFYIIESYYDQYDKNSFYEELNQTHVYSMWYCASDIQSWFVNTFKKITIDHNQYSSRIQNAIQYIRTHYDQDLTLEEVAENLGISYIYLSKLFKKETGQTFLEYLTKYRIEKAKYILRKGDYKVYEVAEQVGYKTSQYFSSVFRKNTGMNPSDYIR